MGRSIAFDNSVLSPLIKSVVDESKLESDKDKVNAKRARHLVEQIQAGNQGLDKEKQVKINLPMPALTECLAGWPAKEQAVTLMKLKKLGSPIVYDEAAALIAGRMWSEMKEKGLLKVEREKERARDCVKFDVMIAACCKAHGVNTVYFEDRDFTSFAKLDACKGMRFEKLPADAGTKDLFEGVDSGKGKTGTAKEEE